MAMTATSTRSTRRAEGVGAHSLPHPQRATRHHQQLLQQSNSSRPLKRLHEATNLAYDHKPPKKAKFEIEIPSKSQYQARLYPENVDARQQQQQQHHQRPARVASVSATHNKPPKHDHQPTTAPPPQASEPSAPATPAPTPVATKNTTNTKEKATTGLTKHREKVVNGIKHELDRLQPDSKDTASISQGRKLRSQEGVRYKSELSAYFPEYDEVIGNVPKQEPTFADILKLDTPILIVETSPSSSAALPIRQPHSSTSSTFPIRTYSDELFTKLNDSQIIDLTWLEAQVNGKALSDPLPDSYYEPIHRKESRNEKITRNAEKGRSQHEKEQVIRLLDGLRGPDWLKTMGVSGITESKKKEFQPARAHFVNKCEAVLEKFRKWAAEEKRLKLEKDRAAKESRASQEVASIQDEDDEEVEDEEEEEDEDNDNEGNEQDEDEEQVNKDDAKSDSDPPDLSDVDASAKQLHEEAMARSRIAVKSARRRPVAPELPPPSPAEFKSFFEKPYQRDAALNKTRRRGRTVLAWGHSVPELEQQDFDLPEEYRDEDMLKSRARRLRRLQRGNKNRG